MPTYECIRCHRLFQSPNGEEICAKCAGEEDEEFGKIREYLSAHRGASSSDVMREVGVSLKLIKRYLKQERLEIIGDNKGFIKCEKCGAPLNSGRLCESCYKDTFLTSTRTLKPQNQNSSAYSNADSYKEDKQKPSGGLRYGDKKR